MRTPGMQMMGTPPAGGTRVLCPTPDCDELLCRLPAETQLLTRSQKRRATGSVTGRCGGCGEEFDLPVREADDGS